MEGKHESKKGGEIMAWQEPKTDWTAQNTFNYKDYNRIKNNLVYLHEQVCEEWVDFPIEDMGEDLLAPEEVESDSPPEKFMYDAMRFNAFEANVDTINQHMLKKDYGFRQTFYYNGAFPKPEEFNRLENATLNMKRINEGKKSGKIRLAFRFGAPKGLYV